MIPKRLVTSALHYSQIPRRCYANPAKQPGFVRKLIDNIQQEFSRNKEMSENISKFREEAQKLEESEALQQARRKFKIVEAEASESSKVIKEKLETAKGAFQDVLNQAGSSEFAKRASEVGEQLGKQAQNIAESGAKLANTPSFKAVSGAAATIKEEIVDANLSNRIYRPPQTLRKRTNTASVHDSASITPDSESLGVELHKDSKFYQSWEKFKENNPYVNKVIDWKIKYDESDNPMIRASRLLTEKVSEIMGGLFQRTEMSETLTEIIQIDPTFDKEVFLKECEQDIIPNILEAASRSELEILEDWCYEGAYALMSQPLKAAKERGLKMESQILDISHVDLAMGRVLEQGPVLVITFTTQVIQCFRDAIGKVVEGDPSKVFRVNHAWVLCRERNELNPKAAWRLLEFSASATEQLV